MAGLEIKDLRMFRVGFVWKIADFSIGLISLGAGFGYLGQARIALHGLDRDRGFHLMDARHGKDLTGGSFDQMIKFVKKANGKSIALAHGHHNRIDQRNFSNCLGNLSAIALAIFQQLPWQSFSNCLGNLADICHFGLNADEGQSRLLGHIEAGYRGEGN